MTEHFHGPFGGSGPDGSGQPGPIAAEALRLVSSMQDWARRSFPEAGGEPIESDCQWCPLCQFVAVLRGERPEVTERVAEAGTAVASALRAIFDAASTAAGQAGQAGQSGRPGQPGQPGQHRHPGASDGPRVQRINLDPES